MEREPYNKSKDEIDKYHRHYIANVLFYPRDKYGELKVAVEDSNDFISEKDIFWNSYKEYDFPEWMIEEAWNVYHEQNKYSQEENDKNLIALFASLDKQK